ncbi:MAG: outer membrane export factor [uncultured bacterium]|nr:MAG: outer membrane export factor [uncultured bacterium]
MRQWVVASFLVLLSLNAWGKSAWTLPDLYQQALNQSETVQISKEKILEIRAQFLQILGGRLPQIGHQDSVFFQDKAPSNANNNANSNLTRRYRPEVKFYFSQPLFQGFSEYHVAKMKKAALSKAQYDLSQEELNLYQDLTTVVITLNRINRDIKDTQNVLLATRERWDILTKHVDLGKARLAQQYAEEAQIHVIENNLTRLKTDRQVVQDTLIWMTGLNPLPPIAPPGFTYKKLPPLTNIAHRPDVLAAQANTIVSKRELKVSQAKLLPTINADANYYAHRVGVQKDIDWDAMLTLDLPLFNMANWGAIRTQKSLLAQAALAEKKVAKEASLGLDQARIRFESSQKEMRQLELASRAAQKNFEASVSDFKLGLIDNLDVLESQQAYLEILLQKNQSKANQDLAYVTYWIETGQKP